jgi:hypothetical protein
MSAAPKNEVRCEFTYSDGRRCRQSRRDPSSSFCFRHWRCEQQKEEAARVGDEIVGAEGALNTQEGIHKALANVFCNLARNRISARNAAVLGYVGQLMLVSRPSIERTMKSFLPAVRLALTVGHQNAQAKSVADLRFHKMALDEIEVTNALIGQFNLFKSMSHEEFLKFAEFCAAHVDKKDEKNVDKKKEAAPDAKA